MNAPNCFTRLGLCLSIVLALIPTVPAHADTSATRAARLTFVQGTVTVVEPNGGDSVPAQLNLPLLAGVQLVTANDGQAEVEFEDGSIVRLTPNSALSLDNLAIQGDGTFVTNLSLLRGLAYCELRATPQYRYWVNVGGDVLSPVENTTVRINFDEPPAIISVLDGTAEVDRQGASTGDGPSTGYQTQVRAGESLSDDPSSGSRYFLTQQITQDSWDQWNEDRDQAAVDDASDSTAVRNDYAGAQGYGWSDLDANGDWYNVPGQGTVWQPQIAVDDPDFDPYGNGAWVYYPNSGYIWASSYSWGWTPYRCGNWSYYNSFGWGWAPGAGCGSRGWGFSGGGRPVNIVIGPTGYRPIRVPVSGSPHPRPIWPIHSPFGTRPKPVSGLSQGPRRIAGVTVQPVAREHRGPQTGQAGSALHRDFPIDSHSKAPVMGLASTSPTVKRGNSGPGSVGQRPRAADPQQSNQGAGQPDTYGGRRYPSNVPSAPANTATQPQGSRSYPSDQGNRTPVVGSSPTQPTGNQQPPSYRRPTDNSTPNQPNGNQQPSYRRPADNSSQAQPTVNQPPSNRRPADNSTPSQPTGNQPPSYRRPADNNSTPSQPPSNQNNYQHRPDAGSAPTPRPADPSPSYQRNPPQPTTRPSPPAERPVERSSPPPAERSAPPPSPPPAQHSAPPSPPPAPPSAPPPATHPTTQPGPARNSPN